MNRNIFIILYFISYADSAVDKNLYCGACRAIISEIEHSVSQVDPKKTIDVGSFRVDPDGKTRTIQKAYARSETYLTEVLEGVCKEVSDNYVESKDPDTGKALLKRMVTHDGKMASDVDFKQLMEDSKDPSSSSPPDAKSKKVKFACESIVEDFEDEILHHFKNAHKDGAVKICSDVAEYCDVSTKDEL